MVLGLVRGADVKAILLTGLVAGTLDITSAVVHFSILYGATELIRLFWFIASGAFGKEAAYAGGWPMAFMGLLFHYVIAYSWTVLYFLIYPRLKFLGEHPVISGVAYGLFVWAVMNLIVLPLSRIPPIPFVPSKAALAAAILISFIGLPIAIGARRHYRRVPA